MTNLSKDSKSGKKTSQNNSKLQISLRKLPMPFGNNEEKHGAGHGSENYISMSCINDESICKQQKKFGGTTKLGCVIEEEEMEKNY